MPTSLSEIKLTEICETIDDIVSSGYGWSDWHQKELKEELSSLNIPARRQVFKQYYCIELPEGVSRAEVRFMATLCKANIKNVKFS